MRDCFLHANPSEHVAQSIKIIPLAMRVLPIPAKGDTILSNMKHTAPSKAEAAPAFWCSLSMARVEEEVKVIPMVSRSGNNTPSYIQK